jgi:hypothetical protein
MLTLQDKVLPSSMQAIKFSLQEKLSSFHVNRSVGGTKRRHTIFHARVGLVRYP